MEYGLAAMSALLAAFSTTVMGYVSLATVIGPWVAPTLVLCGTLLFRLCGRTPTPTQLTLTTVAGSVGGIAATALAFSVPTLFFLDPPQFCAWMADPPALCALLAGIILSGGGVAFCMADLLEKRLLDDEQLPFPIGRIAYGMIIAQQQMQRAYELLAGFVSSAVFAILQRGCAWDVSSGPLIPRSIPLLRNPITWQAIQIPAIRFDLWPMLWAIGFVTGHVIALPLGVGAISRILLVDPLWRLYFSALSEQEYFFAFFSGMVVCGVLLSGKSMLRKIKCLSGVWSGAGLSKLPQWCTLPALPPMQMALTAGVVILFLSWCGFSPLVQLYLVVLSALFAQQIATIAGKFGIAPLGRFATFAMLPGMLLFQLTLFQIVLIAAFVEVCGGVTADLLFGRRMGRLAGVSRNKVRAAQLFGLVVCALVVGAVFWILINKLSLGSDALCAFKAQNRALLVQAFLGSTSFDLRVFALGLLFSVGLSLVGINGTLVLGGLLMHINLSLALVVGGLFGLLVKDRIRWEPFWSGVFAADSMVTVFTSLLC